MNEVKLNNFINGGSCLGVVAVIALALAYFYNFVGLYDTHSSVGILFRPEISSSDLAAFSVNAIFIAVNTILIVYLNKRYAFIREYTLLHATYFIILTFSVPSLVAVANSSVIMIMVVLLSVLVLFGGYQQRQRRSFIFLISFILAVGSMFNYAFVLLLPVFVIGFFQVQLMCFKGFVAMLIGLFVPYWIVLGLGIADLSDIALPKLAFTADAYIDIVTSPLVFNIAMTILTGAILSAINMFRLMSYKLQLRSYNGFITILAMAATVLLFVDINNVYFYLTILNICLAFHVAHFFTIEKLRRGYILFAVLALVNLSGWIGFEVIRYLI